jgi:hypothetical protein
MEPKKWKETINPFEINFDNFKLVKVLGYPHARNDVFYVKGIYKNKNVYAYIKYCSIKGSNLLKELNFLKNKNIPNKPIILDHDKESRYIVTRAVRGKRLSEILKKELLSSQRHSLDLFYACTLKDGDFRVPLGDAVQSNKVEQLINSIIKNRINKQEIAGGPVV